MDRHRYPRLRRYGRVLCRAPERVPHESVGANVSRSAFDQRVPPQPSQEPRPPQVTGAPLFRALETAGVRRLDSADAQSMTPETGGRNSRSSRRRARPSASLRDDGEVRLLGRDPLVLAAHPVRPRAGRWIRHPHALLPDGPADVPLVLEHEADRAGPPPSGGSFDGSASRTTNDSCRPSSVASRRERSAVFLRFATCSPPGRPVVLPSRSVGAYPTSAGDHRGKMQRVTALLWHTGGPSPPCVPIWPRVTRPPWRRRRSRRSGRPSGFGRSFAGRRSSRRSDRRSSCGRRVLVPRT